MARFTNTLNYLKVAAPCSADWDEMVGTDRARFCAHCNLNVYNLSGMSKREAEALLARTEGRLCVRFYRRADGTILTDDCPEGLRAIKRRARRAASAVLSTVLSFFAGLGVSGSFAGNEPAQGGLSITPPASPMDPVPINGKDQAVMGVWEVGQVIEEPVKPSIVIGQVTNEAPPIKRPTRRKRIH